MADIHVFDRILSKDEMIGMTTCDGSKLEGNLINSNRDNSTVYGWQATEISIHPEKFCPKKNFSGLFFNQWHWNVYEAIDL